MTDFVYADKLKPGSIPSPINKEYADESARLSATDLDEYNLFDFARQLDDNSVWMLIQVTPVLNWKRMDPGMFQETTRDLDIYFNSTGDDVLGNGTNANPFKTWDRAIAAWPHTTKHTVRFHPSKETYNSFPRVVSRSIVGDGMVIWDASGLTYDVLYSGTVTNVTEVADMGTFTSKEVTDIETGDTWSVDQFYGKYIQITSGVRSGTLCPVAHNTATAIRTGFALGALQIGDDFDIVDIPVKINIDHPVEFDIGSDHVNSNTARSNFYMGGISFINTTTEECAFDIEATTAVMMFCSFAAVANPYLARVHNSAFNKHIEAGVFANPALEACALTQWLPNGLAPPTVLSTTYPLDITNSSFNNFVARCKIAFKGNSGSDQNGMCCGWVFSNCSAVQLITIYVHYYGLTDPEGYVCWLFISSVQLGNVYFDDTYGIYMKDGGTAKLFEMHGSTSLAPYTFHLEGGAYVWNTRNCDVVGSAGVVLFNNNGSIQAAWPPSKGVYSAPDGSYLASR